MNVKNASCEISDRNDKHIVGNCRKVDPCYKVANSLDIFGFSFWKIILIINKLRYLTEKTYKQSFEVMAWCLLENSRENRESKGGIVKEKETNIERFGKFSAHPYFRK